MTNQQIAQVFNQAHVQNRVVEGKQGANWITLSPTAEFRLKPATMYARIEQRPDNTLLMEQGFRTREEAEALEAGVIVLPAVEYQV